MIENPDMTIAVLKYCAMNENGICQHEIEMEMYGENLDMLDVDDRRYITLSYAIKMALQRGFIQHKEKEVGYIATLAGYNYLLAINANRNEAKNLLMNCDIKYTVDSLRVACEQIDLHKIKKYLHTKERV